MAFPETGQYVVANALDLVAMDAARRSTTAHGGDPSACILLELDHAKYVPKST
jgi:hypothetical protein